jgi:hypothetical protein
VNPQPLDSNRPRGRHPPATAEVRPAQIPTLWAGNTRPLSKMLHRAVLLSDGASRLVDPFGLATWEELLALLDEGGPEELLRQVRTAEATDPEGRRWPRTKCSDDATAVYVALLRANPPGRTRFQSAIGARAGSSDITAATVRAADRLGSRPAA